MRGDWMFLHKYIDNQVNLDNERGRENKEAVLGKINSSDCAFIPHGQRTIGNVRRIHKKVPVTSLRKLGLLLQQYLTFNQMRHHWLVQNKGNITTYFSFKTIRSRRMLISV
ncbi:hypothetical protein AB3S75_015986 [Citrus x aurantiifolia]